MPEFGKALAMFPQTWLDTDGVLLGTGFPLPLDTPFTTAMAKVAGVHASRLQLLAHQGLLRHPLHGVYAATQTEDSIAFRCQALGLVLPTCAVVTDRTAGWLHGVPILKRGAHLVAPDLDVCETTDSRVRRPGVDGRRRELLATDVTEIHGIPVTTLRRTTLDLGRRLWRFDALAAIDGALRLGLDHELLLEGTLRFAGHRGVRQLRMLAPLGDGRAESPGESALRLHWYDAGLPPPDPQYEILDDFGAVIFRLDVPLPAVRYAAEYDGEEFHTGDEDRVHDTARRKALDEDWHWEVDVFTKKEVYGSNTRIVDELQIGLSSARKRFTRWKP